MAGSRVSSWERQPAESTPAFQAFVAYRDGGPERSVRAVAQKLGKSASLIGRWSSQHAWSGRVAAWDREHDRIRQQAQRESVEEVSARQASVIRTHIEAIGSVGVVAARRLASEEEGIESMDAGELLALMAKLARPLTTLLEAERELHGLRPPDPANDVPPMTRAQAEAYLLGVGLDDLVGDTTQDELNT